VLQFEPTGRVTVVFDPPHQEQIELDNHLDEWIRRKLRCYRLKQCKRGRSIAELLQRMGASPSLAHRVASSAKGWWRLSLTRAVHQAMSQEWFASQGLVSVTDQYDALQH
jgi:RNA-directed DNA polymerase